MAQKKNEKNALFVSVPKSTVRACDICTDKNAELYTDGYRLYIHYHRVIKDCKICGQPTHNAVFYGGKPICQECCRTISEWSKKHRSSKKADLFDTGFDVTISSFGNGYVVSVPSEIKDEMFSSYDSSKFLKAEIYDDEFLIVVDSRDTPHNCFFCGRANAQFEINSKHICYSCAKKISMKGECAQWDRLGTKNQSV